MAIENDARVRKICRISRLKGEFALPGKKETILDERRRVGFSLDVLIQLFVGCALLCDLTMKTVISVEFKQNKFLLDRVTSRCTSYA